ncbi:hypothetical protein AGMMS49982_17840 [Bacteroidia bacterium]|nr:hypothetical protein AGMMS49982_17840 [Bacteroidia bacterium]
MRKLAILLCLCVAAGAVEAQVYSGGDGSKADPYKISSKADMRTLKKAVESGNSYAGKHFVLINNLTGKNAVTTSIGKFHKSIDEPSKNFPFSGTFDGGGFTIELKNAPNGVFAYVANADIKRLKVSGSIKAVVADGEEVFAAGAICGVAYMSKISFCSNSATVADSIDSMVEQEVKLLYVAFGGICGANYALSQIVNCYNTGAIMLTVSGENGAFVGGIAGSVEKACMLQNCYNTANLSAPMDGWGWAGGIVGSIDSGDSWAFGCFASNEWLSASYTFGTGITNPANYIEDGKGSSEMVLPLDIYPNYFLAGMTGLSDSATYAWTKFGEPFVWSELGLDGPLATATDFQNGNWLKESLGWDFDDVWDMSVQGPILKPNPKVKYSILISRPVHGSISPSGGLPTDSIVTLEQGDSLTLNFSPAVGYDVYKIKVDGKSFSDTSSSYTFRNVSAMHTIEVFFSKHGALSGNGSMDVPYQISSKADMEYLAEAVAEGNDFEGKFFKLMNNLTDTNTVTTSVGFISGGGDEWYAKRQQFAFAGVFDGGGYTIEVNNEFGVFGYIKNATIQNLNVSGTVNANDASFAGGVCAYAAGHSTVIYCSNAAEVSCSGNFCAAGGICGCHE